jgi:hypothetical protein
VSKRLAISVAIALPVLLTGCPSANYPTCSSEPVIHPDGKCSAYYYKTDYGSGGVTTQALTDCAIDSQRLGGNIVAFHSLEHGIGLRWVDSHTLEVSVADGIKLESQRMSDVYSGYPLTYIYRSLPQGSPEFLGCKPKRQSGGT